MFMPNYNSLISHWVRVEFVSFVKNEKRQGYPMFYQDMGTNIMWSLFIGIYNNFFLLIVLILFNE
jgi:hypothetical protein